MRRSVAAVAAVALVLVAGKTSGAPPPAADGELLIVGATVHQREIGSLDVRVETDGYLIPIDGFAEIARCEIGRIDGGPSLITPLGTVALYEADLREADGIVYLRERAIEEKLATPVVFDPTRYSLDFDLPWRRVTTPHGTLLASSPIPDVTPPDLSLSTLQSDLRYTRGTRDGSFGTSTMLGGKMLDGYWRLRYQDDLEGAQTLRDYAWFHMRDERLFLAGHQQVRLHPLLQSLEMTGLQLARTNQPLERFSRSSEPGALLTRNLEPFTVYRGQGPVAGVAELWVDGSLAERRAIGLDGIYEFDEVSLPARRANRVEVRVYDRKNLETPLAIHEEDSNVSEFLLAAGALIQMGGLGQTGNLADRESRSRDGGKLAGFYQTRYGATDRLTIETAVQSTGERQQAFGGIVSRLGRVFVLSLGLASSDGVGGYRMDLDGRRGPWRLIARSQGTDAGFLPQSGRVIYDHLLETGYERRGRFDLSLISRSWKSDSNEVAHVLPAFNWRPLATLALGARPDHYGEYRFDLSYRMRPATRMSASSIDGRRFVGLSQRLGSRYHLSLESEFGEGGPERQGAIVSWQGQRSWRPTWTAGLLRSDGTPGYLAGGSMALVPGLLASVQYESETLVGSDETLSDRRFLVNLTADLGFAGGRVHAARATSVGDDRGGVGGIVRIDAPAGFPRPSLAGLSILVDGGARTETESDGSFFVGGLSPGIHELELDRENLPIELTPVRVVILAEVATAAVTRLDFVVRPELGIAGRVIDAAGRPVAGIALELRDTLGGRFKTATTDRFGLYRMDGLPLGRYALRPIPDTADELPFPLPQRTIEIESDFLFDQDLELPVVLERAPDPREMSDNRAW